MELPKPKPTALNFDVSAGLKSVLGSDLITDDEVALFELVKNSFDAQATKVVIFFGDDEIAVIDDGHGMSLDDLQHKWLFVAYSAKKESTFDFRDSIADRKHFAGSKGIGRFSSDRLGAILRLQSRPRSEPNGKVHTIEVSWDDFDRNLRDKFDAVDVRYVAETRFVLPLDLPELRFGTCITISQTRKIWGRNEILSLKSSLAKLINPFGSGADNFSITIIAPNEIEQDNSLLAQYATQEELPANIVANGEVGNFIFSTLQERTTCLSVSVSEAGMIDTVLSDRGELVYHIREKNNYPRLNSSSFRAQLFFLNQSAKLTFARRMGVPSVQFGSVFLFRNGFRVYPVGEAGDDWFGMDQRKSQGYSRYLGTRDIIGRIEVEGSERDFAEASSRNAGLIETPAVQDLKKLFLEKCLRRLELYVVPVTFVDPEDKKVSDISRLLTDPGRARVTAAVAKLVEKQDVELITYSERLVGVIDERAAEFEDSLVALRNIASTTGDVKLLARITAAEKRFATIKKAEEAARQEAERERQEKEAALAAARAAEEREAEVRASLEEEKKRNLFLSSISTLDTDTIVNLHHQVTIYSVDINQHIENFIIEMATDEISKDAVLDTFEAISLLNRKIMGITKFATKANFRLEAEHIEADLARYIAEYVLGVATDHLHGPLRLECVPASQSFVKRFKPIDIAIVIDNLITNAKKAGAGRIHLEILVDGRSLQLIVTDNGRGLHKRIDPIDRIFDKGFSTTDGSGLGLYHVKNVLAEMGGCIHVLRRESGTGTIFKIGIENEA